MEKQNGMKAAAVALALACGILGTRLRAAESMQAAAAQSKQVELKTAMRKLWADHVVWTRLYIISAVADMPDAKAASDRLLKNQDEIGDAIAPYYGKDAGAKLADLLKKHIQISVDVVAAAKAGQDEKLKEADKRWHDNAQGIAAFLSGANPNWSKDSMTKMLNEHLAVTTEEALGRIKKDWSGDVATFDKVFDQAMMMADDLTDGIVKQFPDKFLAAK